jgi:hypothetical protein
VTAIPLSRGLFATVDESDVEAVSAFKWSALKSKSGTTYAVRMESIGTGKRRIVYMHRFLMGFGAGDGRLVDHRDGNGLNNVRSNLRPATNAQNVCNKRHRRSAAFKYKGTRLLERRGRPWGAAICANGKRINLGYYETAEEAAMAYDRAATELHGEFARLNFPARAKS